MKYTPYKKVFIYGLYADLVCKGTKRENDIANVVFFFIALYSVSVSS